MSNVIIPGRFVVCAANRVNNPKEPGKYLIVAGARHFDAIMHQQIKQLHQIHDLDGMALRWEQGFIDQHGVFMDRREALQVATEAGQLNTRRSKTSPEDRLFSEDLY